jgi:hypothetical protein
MSTVNFKKSVSGNEQNAYVLNSTQNLPERVKKSQEFLRSRLGFQLCSRSLRRWRAEVCEMLVM